MSEFASTGARRLTGPRWPVTTSTQISFATIARIFEFASHDFDPDVDCDYCTDIRIRQRGRGCALQGSERPVTTIDIRRGRIDLQKRDHVYNYAMTIESDSDPAATSYAYPFALGGTPPRDLKLLCGLRLRRA